MGLDTEPVTGLSDTVRKEGTMQARLGAFVFTLVEGQVYTLTVPITVTDTTVSQTPFEYEWSGSVNLGQASREEMEAYVNAELAAMLDTIRADLNQRRAAAEAVETTAAQLAASAQAAIDAILAAA